MEDFNQEKERIGKKVDAMRRQADFPLELLPLEAARTVEEAAVFRAAPSDVVIAHAAAAWFVAAGSEACRKE